MRHKKPIIHLVAGTRPNFVKIAPLFHELNRGREFEPLIVHTGQHHDQKMSEVFFEDLDLPKPHIYLGNGGGSHATQTARILVAYEAVCDKERPDCVVVVGDVDSTLAACVAAKKRQLTVAHLESGLRSRDRTMPEEINRLAVDAISDILWTPSPDATRNLKREGADPARIYEVGNIMIDSLEHSKARFRSVRYAERLGLEARCYAVVTLHRPSNVDDTNRLTHICKELMAIGSEMPVVFPVHPRTRQQLQNIPAFLSWAAGQKGFHLLDPLGYLEFLSIVSEAAVVLTDSGGLQEETAYLKVPCLTLRENTERPLTLGGTSRLVPVEGLAARILKRKFETGVRRLLPKSWDGKAAQRAKAHLAHMLEVRPGRKAGRR